MMHYLTRKNILIVSPEPWSHVFVSKHHYAIELAKTNRVFFLNPPSKELRTIETSYERLTTIDYNGHTKGLRFLPSWLQKVLIRKTFNSLERLTQVEFDVIWSFDNSVFFRFDALPKSVLKISHIVDLNQNFETEKAASSADYCFCTTDQLKNRLLNYNSNVFKIHHGYNQLETKKSKLQIPGKQKTKVSYIGNLSMAYLDWKPILEVVNNHPTIDFIFIGPIQENDENATRNEVQGKENTFFLGKISANEIPMILSQMDAHLVSYQEKYHEDQANPHKFMEYLGSGKVVVCTYTGEYASLQGDLISMAKGNHEFSPLFSEIIQNLPHFNSEAMQKDRKAFAQKNSYSNKVQEIDKILSNHR